MCTVCAWCLRRSEGLRVPWDCCYWVYWVTTRLLRTECVSALQPLSTLFNNSVSGSGWTSYTFWWSCKGSGKKSRARYFASHIWTLFTCYSDALLTLIERNYLNPCCFEIYSTQVIPDLIVIFSTTCVVAAVFWFLSFSPVILL